MAADEGNNSSSSVDSDPISSLAHFIDTLLTAVPEGFRVIGEFLGSFWDGFCDILGKLFVVDFDMIEPSYNRLKNTVAEPLMIAENFKTAFSAFNNTEGQPIKYEFDLVGYHFKIDMGWYEPYRLTIRSGLGSLFVTMAMLKILSIILNALGIKF